MDFEQTNPIEVDMLLAQRRLKPAVGVPKEKDLEDANTLLQH